MVIEQVNGQIKNKFRCLIGSGLHLSPVRACDVLVACCVLHNVSKDLKEPQEYQEMEGVAQVRQLRQPLDPVGGGAVARRNIIQNYFS